MISVLILTKNEELNLPACLEAVSWSDDLVVFDSGSTDRTLELAQQAGARIIHRTYDNEHNQRTESLKVSFKYPWVYNPDADEITPPELRDEMLRVVADSSRREVAYRVRFKVMFMGRWLKHSSLYPTWVVRLFRPETISFERSTNLRYHIEGPEGKLQEHFLHYTFNKGLEAWVAKHAHYAHFEAEESLKFLRQGRLDIAGLFTWRDAVRRRRSLKTLSFYLPGRALLRFCYMYLWRGGFLDGAAGLSYCRLLAFYEYLITLNMKEIRRREQGLPI